MPRLTHSDAEAKTMRVIEDALTFDDVLLVPAHSTVLPNDVDLRTKLTRDINLNIPLVSAAMDTVTESRFAIALALEGGIGIVHKNMTPEEQAQQVANVKKYEAGVIRSPITVAPNISIGEVVELTSAHNISGVPVVDGDKLVGIVTGRDLRFETKMDDPVRNIMTRKDKLVTVNEGADRDEVLQLLHKYRIEKVLVVNGEFKLRGMITVKDIQKAKDNPNACRDDQERLRVGAAVGVGAGTEERVERLAEAGVDVIVVDTAHGHSQGVLDRVAWVKKHYPEVQVIGGNIATAEAAQALVDAGADAVKVGIGPGSICTTRIVAGVGVPQVTAVSNVAKQLEDSGVPLIADGGLRYSGDIAKVLASGAYSVMVGGMFAGTDESPGEVEIFQGRSYKSYRGMGSLGAMSGKQGSSDRYFQESTDKEKLVPEGIEGRVPYKGSVTNIIYQLVGGIRSSMGYTGCANLDEMRTKPRFVRVTGAGMTESHVHDVTITKEAPNYRRD
ncbi:inosine-5'-monophosphate dehydrogenase [endosymbiont of Tevnia jerichonana (vent Tica)]|jgi:IMP dehydrogenase|uniref:Inosine-5'-monophosphate dehydrogenase n=4 Tax=Gammaproteobacteria TaxID=1236 RepID=G2FDK1_9GAMM|nr:inosine-5'-monophosphate dehydrogenase [endosymbiont of Tevnia jerichonana (vent Tica)]